MRRLPLLFLPFVALLLAADPPRAKKTGTQWAILIAAARYTHLEKIPGEETINDIVEFKKALNATGFKDEHIVMMHDRQAEKGGAGAEYLPEYGKITDTLTKFLKGMDETDTAVVVLSGHGVMFKGDTFGHFCPTDARTDPKEKLIPMEGPKGIYTLLDQCGAGRKLLIANTCRNPPAVVRPTDLAGDRIELVDEYPELKRVPKGIAAFYACSPEQRSKFDPARGRSLFMLHLTDAWKAGADLDDVFKAAKDNTKADALKTFKAEQLPVKKVNYEGEWLLPSGPGRKGGEEVEFEIADGVKMVFCWIPPGECQLGSPKAEREAVMKSLDLKEEPDWLKAQADAARGKYETKKGFWLGKHPVTQAEWTAVGTARKEENWFSAKGGGAEKLKDVDTGRFPVESVSWDECHEFVTAVNKRAGAAKVFGQGEFRLPHENEWEYACRGGKGNKQPFYWGDTLNGDKANCQGIFPFGTTTKGEYKGRPTVVGSYAEAAPHPWGLCDMTGNVKQWCYNNYSSSSSDRAVRGGSWLDSASGCRTAVRHMVEPGGRGINIGFRLMFRPE